MALVDQDILQEIQYAVVEPPNPVAAFPSGLWTLTEVLAYANDRQRRFLKDTGVVLTRSSITAIPNTQRHELPAGWIQGHRVVWLTPGGSRYELPRMDGWQFDHGLPTWPYNTAARPEGYMEEEVPTLQIQVAPASYDGGTIELLYAALGTALSGAGVAFSVPDECVPAIKYGILADMFGKVGQGQDLSRADYCEQRYQHGVEATRLLLDGFRS